MPAGYGTALYYAGMTRRWRVGLVAGLTAIGLVASATGNVWASPNVLLVQPTPQTGRYTSIQAAVNAANPGDWVLVAPGVYHEKGYSPTDGSRPAEVYITKANLHLRGMNRDTVIVDGTNFSTTQGPGTSADLTTACSSDPALQDPGVVDTSSVRHAREGILVFKTPGVSIENLSSCNSMSNEIWWNNGDGTGVQGPMPLSGNYITATSTYYKDAVSPSAQYGIFTSNVSGPGVNGTIDNSYANNMTDSSYYIGACRDCNITLNHPHAEYSALGLSTTNAGGNLLIENGEWDNNRTGLVSNSQNNDDAPSPQYGQCVSPSTPPTGAGPNSCDLWTGNYIHDNNNPNTPGVGLTAVSAVGAGVELAATQHISVVANNIVHNGSWGVVTHDFPDPEQGPSGCEGGVNNTTSGVCLFFSRGNHVANNTFATNGFFANPTNSDIANQATGALDASGCAKNASPACTPVPNPDPNCFTGNTGTPLTEDPPNVPPGAGLQEFACPPGTSDSGALTAQLVCATGAASLFTPGFTPPPCPTGASYPQHDGNCTGQGVPTGGNPPGDNATRVCFLPLSYTLSSAVSPPMLQPCDGVPANDFCPGSVVPEGPPGLLLIGGLLGLFFLAFGRRPRAKSRLTV